MPRSGRIWPGKVGSGRGRLWLHGMPPLSQRRSSLAGTGSFGRGVPADASCLSSSSSAGNDRLAHDEITLQGRLQRRYPPHQLQQLLPFHAVGGVVRAGVDAARLGAGAEARAQVAGGRLPHVGLGRPVVLLDHVDVAVGTILGAQPAADAPVLDDDLARLAAADRARPGSRPCSTGRGTSGTSWPPGTCRTAAPRGSAASPPGACRRRPWCIRRNGCTSPGRAPAGSARSSGPDPGSRRATSP